MNQPFKPVAPVPTAGRPLTAVGTNPKQPCLSCDGEGEAEWLALDETSPRWLICDDCDGTGYAKKPYCETCQGKLTVDGYCYSCEDYAGWALAEHSAYGMVRS